MTDKPIALYPLHACAMMGNNGTGLGDIQHTNADVLHIHVHVEVMDCPPAMSTIIKALGGCGLGVKCATPISATLTTT